MKRGFEMNKLSFALVLTLVLIFPNMTLGLDVKKIAYVDLQEALNMSNAGKEAKEAFAQKVEKTREVIDAKQKELTKLKESLEKQSLLLSNEAKKEKQREYEKSVRDYQRFIKDSQDELKRRETEMSQKVIKELRKVVDKIGKKGEYTLIFERSTSGILYAGDALDITQEVINTYNDQRK